MMVKREFLKRRCRKKMIVMWFVGVKLMII